MGLVAKEVATVIDFILVLALALTLGTIVLAGVIKHLPRLERQGTRLRSD